MTIITTAGRPDELSDELAQKAHRALGFPIVPRNKRSVERLQKEYGKDVLVAGKERYELFRIGMEKPFFFHPNSAAFRLKRVQQGETDPLIEASGLKIGDHFLDCTLGLASDSIIAANHIGKSGRCMGLEADATVAFLTQVGLQTFATDSSMLSEAMAAIEVTHMEAVEFLKTQKTATWDVVYIDPMFSSPIEESSNFSALRQAGVHKTLTEEWVREALRVCKRSVVVKERYDSVVFDQFAFKRTIRPSSKIHFGTITK